MCLKISLWAFGITFNGIYVTFPILKVSICPVVFGTIADVLFAVFGAILTGIYVFPSTTIGFIVLF